MNNENYRENKSFLEKILDYKGIIFIAAGIIIRILMLLYYYYKLPSNNPDLWGDLGKNYNGAFYYPPFTMLLLNVFRVMSIDMIVIFAFWAFLLDIIVMFLFYFVLKSFEISNLKYVFGLFLINPFFFLNNVFSLTNCGYHITDSFFFIFLFLALFFYPRKEEWSKYLFYFFLALSVVAKIYSLPIIGFFFLKFLIEKNWNEMKKFLICTVPIVFVFLFAPIFFIDNYIYLIFLWNQAGEDVLPLYIRLIIVAVISLFYIFFRLKKAGIIEITFFSILVMAVFLFFSTPFIRYFQPLLIYGILTPYVFFTFTLNLGFIKRKIDFDNNLLVFYSSFILVGIAYLIIIFLL
ncbi:MAG: hypothetical protein ACFFDX_07025 [Candidatus Odinarchaeota archaeon]